MFPFSCGKQSGNYVILLKFEVVYYLLKIGGDLSMLLHLISNVLQAFKSGLTHRGGTRNFPTGG